MKKFDEQWLRKYQSKQGSQSAPKRGDAEDVSSVILAANAPPAKREASITPCIYLPVTPVAKPRMTRSDKWKKRPCVLRYREYCDALRKAWGEREFPAAGSHLSFHLPMPKSWSKKKKAELTGQPHQQKPDVDNLTKAVLDALHTDDSHIYDIRASKYWAETGYIEVYLTESGKNLRLAA